MIPITFELTSGPIPRGILSECWERIARAWPSEIGQAVSGFPTLEGIERVRLEVPERRQAYEWLLEALCQIDMWTRQRWDFPPLLESHVRYVAEPVGTEIWASTAALFLRGVGDCEDLACDEAARLRLEGMPAKPHLELEERQPTADLWHVLVALPGGQKLDPSAALGMHVR